MRQVHAWRAGLVAVGSQPAWPPGGAVGPPRCILHGVAWSVMAFGAGGTGPGTSHPAPLGPSESSRSVGDAASCAGLSRACTAGARGAGPPRRRRLTSEEIPAGPLCSARRCKASEAFLRICSSLLSNSAASVEITTEWSFSKPSRAWEAACLTDASACASSGLTMAAPAARLILTALLNERTAALRARCPQQPPARPSPTLS
mmetsp:Transcript_11642/g.36567  ORF Transcript_11642/g.36567 Transcript_11642/m.36567 type:complete len:203 (+) Transcript_11642:1-609(+)